MRSKKSTSMKHIRFFILAVALIAIAGCANELNEKKSSAADAIYYNGDIITMESDSAMYAEAVAIKDGRIIFVGSMAEAEKLKGDSTIMDDLQGKTMLPGFIDGHSHFVGAMAMSSQANCFAPPAGPAKDVDGIISALKEIERKNNSANDDIIIGYGYDENQMPGGRTLNRDDLDKAFPKNPVIVIHVSQHGCVLNSVAMKKFGYSAKTITPAGGIIIRKPGTNEPYGLVMETAFLPVFSNLPKPTPDQTSQGLKDGQMIYAAAGVTTAQEGATHKADMNILTEGAKKNELFIDIVAYPFILDLRTILIDHPFSEFGTYSNHFKIGGVKIVLD